MTTCAMELLQQGEGMRRLFRPSIYEQLESEQLQYYYQRDFRPSHIYRTGVKLFNKETSVRRRVITAPSYSDTHNCLDKIVTQRGSKACNVRAKTVSFHSNQLPTSTSATKDDDDFCTNNWISERKTLRHNLENFGNCEQWLLSKQCTPLENSVLKQIKAAKNNKQLIVKPNIVTESVSVETDEITQAEQNRLKRKEKRQLMKDLEKLEHFIGLSRTRLSGHLVSFDQNRTCILPRNVIIGILDRVRVPVEDFVIDILCDGLEENGMIDYRLLFKRGYCDIVDKYMNSLDKIEQNMNKDSSNESCVEKDKMCSSVVDTGSSIIRDHKEAMDSKSLLTFSTMNGEIGEWSEKIKEESYRQFMKLIEFCEDHGIELDHSLVKKGLLLPQDRTRKQCLSQLRQAGAEAPSRIIVELPVTKNDTGDHDIHDLYGWQYKMLRGSRGSRRVKLSTGIVRVKAKTDCWLTYKQFQQLTEEIQARPGFNYKYHGLPSNSAFWPGALLDKLRLHLPNETKPYYSLYNIFQNVTHSKVCNPLVHVDSTRGMAWPENSSGHVQLGPSLARTRKSYII